MPGLLRSVALTLVAASLGALLLWGLQGDEERLLSREGDEPPPPPAVVLVTPPTSLRTPATSQPTPPSRLDTLCARLQGRRAVVTQTDSRLYDLLFGTEATSTTAITSRNFTASSFGVGPLSLQRWAHAQGLGYLFFSSPLACPEPRVRTAMLAPYWCKVPGMMLVTHIARLCKVPYVMFLDSDVVPADPSMRLESVLERMDHQHADAHIAVVSDSQHWSRLLHWNGDIYAHALNSGAILIRVGPVGFRLLDRWWNELTGVPTPFELQLSRVTVHTPMVAPLGVWSEDHRSVNVTLFMAELSNVLGPSARIQNVRVDRTFPIVAFDLTPVPQHRDVFWKETAELCCTTSKVCFHALNPGVSVVPQQFRCDRTMRSTLAGWPGDQDRLNWLQDQNPEAFVFEPELSHGCNHASSNLKGMLFNHMCFSDNSKTYWSMVTGLEMMREDMAKELETRPWGQVREEWETSRGWSTLKAELVSIAFEPTTSKPSVEDLMRMAEEGRMLLSGAAAAS